MQAPRALRAVGAPRSRTVRRHRLQGTSIPLRRAGELARSDGGPTREQRLPRILLEMLAVTLSKDARARAVQLPAWNEALSGFAPRPWDQQWSLRCQQVLAFETDLLEYPDIFEGSKVIDERTRAHRGRRLERGAGGRTPGRRHRVRPERLHQGTPRRIERASPARDRSQVTKVVGVNCYTETAPSPLVTPGEGGAAAIMAMDPAAEAAQIASVKAWRAARDEDAVRRALDALAAGVARGEQRDAALHRRREGEAPRRENGAPRCAASSASFVRRPASAAAAPSRGMRRIREWTASGRKSAPSASVSGAT